MSVHFSSIYTWTVSQLETVHFTIIYYYFKIKQLEEWKGNEENKVEVFGDLREESGSVWKIKNFFKFFFKIFYILRRGEVS